PCTGAACALCVQGAPRLAAPFAPQCSFMPMRLDVAPFGAARRGDLEACGGGEPPVPGAVYVHLMPFSLLHLTYAFLRRVGLVLALGDVLDAAPPPPPPHSPGRPRHGATSRGGSP